jgi:hypothetical protein
MSKDKRKTKKGKTNVTVRIEATHSTTKSPRAAIEHFKRLTGAVEVYAVNGSAECHWQWAD